jgi:hypothetical protein
MDREAYEKVVIEEIDLERILVTEILNEKVRIFAIKS